MFLFFGYRDWAIDIFKCIKKGILIQDKSLCDLEFINTIKPKIIFFYGWSWIVPKEIIDNYLCICLHPSHLPDYRGGSPIQNQIIDGITDSAVTIFKMNNELDQGDIYYQEYLSLRGNLSSVLMRLTLIGCNGTNKLLKDLKQGNLTFKKQTGEATYCKRRTPKESEIKIEDFSKYNAEYFYNKVRCLQNPYPLPYIQCKQGKLYLKKVDYEI